MHTTRLLLTTCLLLPACDLGQKSIGDTNGDGMTTTTNGGTDTGSGDGDGDGVGLCGEESATDLPSNPDTYFSSPLSGFGDKTVDDFLAVVEGSYAGTFTWGPAEGPVISTYADTAVPITVSAAFAGGDATLYEVEYAGMWVDDGFDGMLCSNRLSFGITLEFATEDGVFVGSLPMDVEVLSHGGSLDPSLVYAPLDLADLQGSLSLADFQIAPDSMINDFVLSATFGETAMTGSLNLEIETMDWVGFGSIASFDATRQ